MENQLLDSDMLNKDEGKSLSVLLSNGYQTQSVEYIKKGFEIFKQNIGGFIGFLIVIGIASSIINAIPFVKVIGMALLAPVIAGFYIVAKMIDKNEVHSFSNFFDGTKNYMPLFIVSIIPTLIIGVVMLVVGGWAYFKMSFLGIQPKINFNDLGSLSAISTATGLGARAGLAGLIAFVITILFIFSTFLVLFERFEPMKAIDISRQIIAKKFFNWVGFMFLLALFNMLGAICLLVGLLVTVPTSICAIYVAYEDVVGLNLRD